MKRLSTIIIAAALLLGMAQCKKQETSARCPSSELTQVPFLRKSQSQGEGRGICHSQASRLPFANPA